MRSLRAALWAELAARSSCSPQMSWLPVADSSASRGSARRSRSVNLVSEALYSEAMAEALAQARACLDHGDVPVGAVVLGPDGAVVSRGRNRRELDNDPTAHAEIVALREAATAAGSWRLTDHTLVVTLEPCAMCAGATVSARIGTLVYAAADLKAGAVQSLYNIPGDARLNHAVDIVDGVMAAEAGELLRTFFDDQR